ncbi:glycoprotein 3-alpha-L-fucosyltransferase A [Physcomitrium patens]|uniref:Fucosyltransferase n=2 Tax=Physcomitrium patens TaxID=3218 RepID=A9RVI9_PHYPA|nr:putative fucosyltransferase-like protein [Physcomitrium patens]XP_024389349.1 putative fucosyltransferase-like protein [Physcomitrium patens]XP_024389350.1 putative fucosyltransferase-like protein [Physcomitrium patens]|eukprot:XP_024389348.1 putative fucosyltransferase-like protein [Physcomitrella patens]
MKGDRDTGRFRRDDAAFERDVEGGERPTPGLLGLRSLASSSGRGWWSKTVLWAVFAVVLIECAFIVRLDILNSPSSSYSSSLDSHPENPNKISGQEELTIKTNKTIRIDKLPTGTDDVCSAEWLEKVDKVTYSRDFKKKPVLVVSGNEVENWDKCSVPCVFKAHGEGQADAEFGYGDSPSALLVLRSMESSAYFPENDIVRARSNGVGVVMTTSLSSDVPVGYFSWAEYKIMDAPKPKTKPALGAAFISNCGAHNDRLTIMRMLQNEGVQIDSYGSCEQNVLGGRALNKLETLREYKFSLAFENSNVEDYVTEKFFQSLVAGSVPIVTGPPNIYDFAPASNSLVYIKDVSEVKAAASRIKYLAENETAYNETLQWKFNGPSDSFLALVDMAAVHSSCRLCIFVATKSRLKEEAAAPKRPCKCTSKSGSTLYHLYVRERGRFEMESVFIEGSKLSLAHLKQVVVDKFTALKHVPIWKTERPEVIRGNSDLRIYKIYPVGLTQREALYTWDFGGDKGLKAMVQKQPCLQLEVVFV